MVETDPADRTPSLGRAVVGLSVVVAVVVGGFLWLKSASDDAGRGSGDGTTVVIRFVRSGGFTGAIDTLVLRDDGTGAISGDTFMRPKRIDIGQEALEDLTGQMDEVWPATAGPVNSGDGCADCPVYGITFREIEVTIYGIPPERFEVPVDRLTALLDNR